MDSMAKRQNLKNRSNCYKFEKRDCDELRRRRSEKLVEIRKSRKSDIIDERRQCGWIVEDPDQDDMDLPNRVDVIKGLSSQVEKLFLTSEMTEKNGFTVGYDNEPTRGICIVSTINSSLVQQKLYSIVAAKKLLAAQKRSQADLDGSNGGTRFSDELVESAAMYQLVQYLAQCIYENSARSSVLMSEIISLIESITSMASDVQLLGLIELNLINFLMEIIKKPSQQAIQLHSKAISSLTSLVKGNIDMKIRLIESGFVCNIIKHVEECTTKYSGRLGWTSGDDEFATYSHCICSLMATLCEVPLSASQELSLFITGYKKLLESNVPETMSTAIRGIYLCCSSPSAIHEIVDHGVFPKIIELLNYNHNYVINEAIIFLTKALLWGNEFVEHISRGNIIGKFVEFIKSSSSAVQLNAIIFLYEYSSKSNNGAQEILDANMVPDMMDILHGFIGDFKAIVEVTPLLKIIFIDCSWIQMKYLLEHNAIEGLAAALNAKDTDVSLTILDIYRICLRASSHNRELRYLIEKFTECSAFEALDFLSVNETNEKIRFLAEHLIETYFNEENLSFDKVDGKMDCDTNSESGFRF